MKVMYVSILAISICIVPRYVYGMMEEGSSAKQEQQTQVVQSRPTSFAYYKQKLACITPKAALGFGAGLFIGALGMVITWATMYEHEQNSCWCGDNVGQRCTQYYCGVDKLYPLCVNT